jgi:hypothetical protein
VPEDNAHPLQKLTEKHQQVAALLAQGLGRNEIAQFVDFTPARITQLTHEPVFQKYFQEMVEFSQLQVEAMFSKTVEVIGEALNDGGDRDGQLKAARLQLEVTGRVGKVERNNPTNEDSINRLTRLAERLTVTLGTMRNKGAIDVEAVELPHSEQQPEIGQQGNVP